jgi:MoaA/NifB/PqqE/SkfB family radical SAM enzyme
VSLDTLRPDRFRLITRRDNEFNEVLEGIEVARAVGLNPVKLNMVVMAGINDDELLDFALNDEELLEKIEEAVENLNRVMRMEEPNIRVFFPGGVDTSCPEGQEVIQAAQKP